ncbi:MAG: hydrogenase expression/formation C-terminal domain-containing protein, partial [Veillonella sp.]|nr:hydrogenase expression/formation C-terminal domain-containing protein [Veillonella sp.]MDU3476062.1 hydrogenase expression/formation C-terminal domain-containing protein [Veillonella sp.]
MIENYGNVRAVLNELRLALKNLRENGETYSIYIEKTGLTEEEQVEVLETLGRGHITINFNETDQPVEWY